VVGHRAAVALITGSRVPTDAVGMLRDAYRVAHRLRARSLLARIGPDMDRVGAAPVDAGAAALLTPREGEVLRLVGDGLTSREIAQRLFLSVRTVEMHVRNGVSKLGCRTRAEAVRQLADATRRAP
jgi:DNA-binding CsgD family transcriptional regulator